MWRGVWQEIDVDGSIGWTVTHSGQCIDILRRLPPSDLTDAERQLLRADALAASTSR